MTFETNGTAWPGSTSYARPPTSAAAGDTIPVLLDDEYHLFHLASPSNTVHFPSRVRCSWLRQRSKDLLAWKRDSDPVIPPGPSKDNPDGSGAWTGSAVLGPDVGEGPRGPFRSPRDGSGGRFDGRRWYAAKSCPKAGDPSKRSAFAWVHDFNQDDGKWLWGGSFTNPGKSAPARTDL
jgi:hypothetical protein